MGEAGHRGALPPPVGLLNMQRLVLQWSGQRRSSCGCIGEAFDEHLRSMGWAPDQRIPYRSGDTFVSAWDWGPLASRSDAFKMRKVRQWHTRWQKNGHAIAVAEAVSCPHKRKGGRRQLAPIAYSSRKRASGGGRDFKCVWLREELFEWWSSIITARRGLGSDQEGLSRSRGAAQEDGQVLAGHVGPESPRAHQRLSLIHI